MLPHTCHQQIDLDHFSLSPDTAASDHLTKTLSPLISLVSFCEQPLSHSGSDSPLPMTHENVTCGVSDEDNPDDHQVPHEEVIDQPVRARPSISMSSDHVRPSSPQVDLYDGSGMIDLVGIRPPARFPGPYPASFTNRLPVQSKKNDLEENSTGGSKTPNKQNGSASLNPWDYVPAEIGLTKDGGPMKAKSRRRFNKRELEVLEVLWSLGKSPSKYQRQRLGAWFGVNSKHITVWYQNRRQEEKRHNRDGGSEPQGSSRSNRGTYDPVTGKWRPVPLSCISSLQTPPKAKRRVVRAISVGKITSEMWFEQRTPKECAPPRPSNALQRRPLLRIASSSLDNVLHAREKGFGETKRMFRRSGDHGLKCEGEERKREMLALMPTDPPSTDPMDSRGEDTEDAIDPEDEENLAPNPLQTVLRFHRPSATTHSTPTAHLGRTSSLDIIASSSRVKRLILHPPRSVSGPSIPSEVIPRLDKRNGSALQSNGESFKRVRRDSHHSSSSRSKPCFRQYEASDRSQPASDMTAPSAALMDHPGLLRSLSYSDRHGSTSARPNPCFRHHDSFDRSQPAQPAPEPGAPPTPLIGTPGLTRSVSFSSPASIFSVAEATLHRVDVHLGNTVYSRGTTMDVDRSEHEAEVDPDVLGAAAQLVQFMRKSGV